jgi:hypothetical protein
MTWEPRSRRPYEDHQERRGIGHAAETPFAGCVRELPGFGSVRVGVGATRRLLGCGQEGSAGGLVELVQGTVSPVAQEQRTHEEQREGSPPGPGNGHRIDVPDPCHLAQFTYLSDAILIPLWGIYTVS